MVIICVCGHPDTEHRRYTDSCAHWCDCMAFVECFHDDYAWHEGLYGADLITCTQCHATQNTDVPEEGWQVVGP